MEKLALNIFHEQKQGQTTLCIELRNISIVVLRDDSTQCVLMVFTWTGQDNGNTAHWPGIAGGNAAAPR